ncbi:MAG: 3'-5' exonuclease [Proteobacteria bacterium]|nr:3'-5' exonuclease [Pseudomonadota bacterium]
MFMPDKETFIVIDVETNGKKIPDGKIIEIAMIKIYNNLPIDYFHSLINPQERLPWFITKLTGIKNSMLKCAPTFNEIALEIVKFIDDGIIVAHNATFDYAYLKCELERSIQNFNLQNEKICTVKLARKKFPELGKYNLDFLSETFNINNPKRHRAYGDAMATAEFFIKHLIK